MKYAYLILIFSVLVFTGAGCKKWTDAPANGISTSTPSSVELTKPMTEEAVDTAMGEIATAMKWPAVHTGKIKEGGLYWTLSPLTLENPQFWFGEKQGNEAPQIKVEKIIDQVRYNIYLETHSKPLTKKFINKERTGITETVDTSKLKTATSPLGTVLCHEFNELSSFDPNLRMAVLYLPEGWRFGAFSTVSCDEAFKYIKMITDKFTK